MLLVMRGEEKPRSGQGSAVGLRGAECWTAGAVTLLAGVPVNTEHRENTREIRTPGERYKYTSR